jgi:hypothetical protein
MVVQTRSGGRETLMADGDIFLLHIYNSKYYFANLLFFKDMPRF